MRKTALAVTIPALLGAASAAAETLQVSPNGARQSVAGAAANFTGVVTVTPLFAASEHSNAGGGNVEFAPGARSAWHTHPAGQTLLVTAGSGWVQQEGREKLAIKAGDVVSIPPGVKHWHGATATSSMTHIAITPSRDGRNVTWLEQVSAEQYR